MNAETDRPTRKASSFLLRHIVDFLSFAVNHYQLSIEEVAMVCLVAVESTRPIVDDTFMSTNFGFERDVLPLEERPAVSLKFVYATLGINRETARRKMERLVNKGFIIKTPEGYILPMQAGETDFSRELRTYLLNRFEAIAGQMDRVRGQ
jgi:Holliday junction resolvasome RuvABC ATP-dependent DNA helicase subunit